MVKPLPRHRMMLCSNPDRPPGQEARDAAPGRSVGAHIHVLFFWTRWSTWS